MQSLQQVSYPFTYHFSSTNLRRSYQVHLITSAASAEANSLLEDVSLEGHFSVLRRTGSQQQSNLNKE
jgi:hypothetical protein